MYDLGLTLAQQVKRLHAVPAAVEGVSSSPSCSIMIQFPVNMLRTASQDGLGHCHTSGNPEAAAAGLCLAQLQYYGSEAMTEALSISPFLILPFKLIN